MIETEERKIKERKQAAHEQEEADRKAGKIKHKEEYEEGSSKEEHKKKEKNPKGDSRPSTLP